MAESLASVENLSVAIFPELIDPMYHNLVLLVFDLELLTHNGIKKAIRQTLVTNLIDIKISREKFKQCSNSSC
jgi:hypothetical protein